MELFEKFKEILLFNPDKIAKGIEDEEPPREIDDIRSSILEYMKKEEEVRNMLPDKVQVSIFEIGLRSIREGLAN